MSQRLPFEREATSAQIRDLWRRTITERSSTKEDSRLLDLLQSIAHKNDQELVEQALDRFLTDMGSPYLQKALLAQSIMNLFFDGGLDLASIDETGQFVWTATDQGLETAGEKEM